MVRIVGAAIIIAATAAYGFKAAGQLNRKSVFYKELEKSLVLLKSEIKYTSATLPEAFISVSARTEGAVSRFYNFICTSLKEDITHNVSTLWKEGYNSMCKEENTQCPEISELGASLGHLNIEHQIKAIDLCMQRLSKSQEQADETLKKKSKMFKTLGVSTGILTVLILL